MKNKDEWSCRPVIAWEAYRMFGFIMGRKKNKIKKYVFGDMVVLEDDLPAGLSFWDDVLGKPKNETPIIVVSVNNKQRIAKFELFR